MQERKTNYHFHFFRNSERQLSSDDFQLAWLSHFQITFSNTVDRLKGFLRNSNEVVFYFTDDDTALPEFLSGIAAPVVAVLQSPDERAMKACLVGGAWDVISLNELTAFYLQKCEVKLETSLFKKADSNVVRGDHSLACLEKAPNIAVQWFNQDGKVMFWNPASAKMFGWSATEAVGRKISDLMLTTEEAETFLEKLRQLDPFNAADEPEEYRFRRRDGSEGYCISSVFALPADGEQLYVCIDVEITRHKQIENALQQSEEKYRQLFQHASDAIFIAKADGEIVDVNEQASALVKYPTQQLRTMNVYDLYTKEDVINQPLKWAELDEGKRVSSERIMTTSDGTSLFVEVNSQKIEEGVYMGVVRDISNRKRAEIALKESEENYRMLVEQQADGIAIYTEQGKILDLNSSAVSMLGYSKEELLRMNIFDLLVPDELVVNPIDLEVLKSGKTTIKQRRLVRKNGDVIHTEVYTKHLRSGHYLISVRDMTERLEVQQKLEREIFLSDTIINSLPGLFYLFKKDGTYLRWNKHLERITGFSASEISKLHPLQLFEGEDRERVAKEIGNVFEFGQSAVEANLVTKQGLTIPYYFTGKALFYQGEECLLGTAIDLSPVRSLQRKLDTQKIEEQKRIIQTMIEAEEKERTKLGEELHDNINQILTVVKMYLTILNTNADHPNISLNQTIDLLNTAIKEIRSLSHNLAISYQFEVGLTTALEELVQHITSAKSLQVHLALPPETDQSVPSKFNLTIYRIVQEGLNNILKYAGADHANVCLKLLPDSVLLTISDNGRGFNLEETKKGLGISNIINRAEAMNGRAVFETAPGKGCTISVQLPLNTAGV